VYAVRFAGGGWPADLIGSVFALSVPARLGLTDLVDVLSAAYPGAVVLTPVSLPPPVEPACALQVTPVVLAAEYAARGSALSAAEIDTAPVLPTAAAAAVDQDDESDEDEGSLAQDMRAELAALVEDDSEGGGTAFGGGVDAIFDPPCSDDESDGSSTAAPADLYGGAAWAAAVRQASADPLAALRVLGADEAPVPAAAAGALLTRGFALLGGGAREQTPSHSAFPGPLAFAMFEPATDLELGAARAQHGGRFSARFGVYGEDIDLAEATFVSDGEAVVPPEPHLARVLYRVVADPACTILARAEPVLRCVLPTAAACVEWARIMHTRLCTLSHLVEEGLAASDRGSASDTDSASETDDATGASDALPGHAMYRRLTAVASSGGLDADRAVHSLCGSRCRRVGGAAADTARCGRALWVQLCDVLSSENDGLVGLAKGRGVAADARQRPEQLAKVRASRCVVSFSNLCLQLRFLLAKRAYVRAKKAAAAMSPAAPLPPPPELEKVAGPDALTRSLSAALSLLWAAVRRGVALHAQVAAVCGERARRRHEWLRFLYHSQEPAADGGTA
jgi:hypothetical protein